MKRALFCFLLLCTSCAQAAVLNVEFMFTPFVGDVAKSEVITVAGLAKVFVNNLPVAEQNIEQKSVPVLFEKREISPAVWVPMLSLGGAVKKGKNILRIEFLPSDAKAPYQARLQWSEVTDQITRESTGNSESATNQANQGMETRASVGKIVLEKEFNAEFAQDLPWHNYPPVSSLSEVDKQALTELLQVRAAAFAPNFAKFYALLQDKPELRLDEIRKAKCVDKAYAAGVRVAAPAAADLEFQITGSAAVVISRKNGALYPFTKKQFERIKGDEAQMCAAFTLALAYPPRMVVSRSPEGKWALAY